MKRFVAAAAITASVWLGLAAPAGAFIIVGGAEATLGGPDTRVGVVAEVDPWAASRTGLLACVADSLFEPCIADATVGVRIDSSGRS